MRVTFYGVRGTSPVTGPNFAEFGGETTSILVEGEGGELIAVDAGTGLRRLGRSLERRARSGSDILILMTHYHLDHLMGLPAFAPLYREGGRVTIAAPLRKGREPKAVVSRIFSAPLWPLQIDSIPARIVFRTLAESSSAGPLVRGGVRVRWAPLHHPGGSTAYRFDEPATGASFVFATDVEWKESSPEEREAFIRFCSEPAPCDLLAFDGQYGEREYRRFRGWGHSTRLDAVEAARLSGARRLLITHHDPSSGDRALSRAEEKLAGELRSARLAREGMAVNLSGPRRRKKAR